MSTAPPKHSGFVPRAIAGALGRKAVRAFLRYGEHRGAMLADSVTYRALFSIFAAVLLGFSVAALWLGGNPVAWQALIRTVDSAVPGLVGEGGLIDPSSIAVPTALSIAGVVSLVGLVGASIGAIGSLRSAIRTLADRVHDDIAWYAVYLRNLVLAVLLGAGLAASAGVTFLATAGIEVVTGWWGWDSVGADIGTWAVSVLAVFALDTAVVAVAFRLLSGVRASARALWAGAVLGGVGLTILQQLSGLFVGGASSNPLLATFAALIALLLWINLSSQVVLLAASYIITGVADAADRAQGRHLPETFAQRRTRVAESAVAAAAEELDSARAAEAEERGRSASPR